MDSRLRLVAAAMSLAIPIERDFDTVTAAEWRAATEAERQAFWNRQRLSGSVSFCCLTCHFPTVHGQSTCEACEPVQMTDMTNRTTQAWEREDLVHREEEE